MIDSHTHLDRGPAPEAELVAAARAVGVKRILTVGIDGESRRAALAAAETYDEVFAAIGHHPNHTTGYDDAIIGLHNYRCRYVGKGSAPGKLEKASPPKRDVVRPIDIDAADHKGPIQRRFAYPPADDDELSICLPREVPNLQFRRLERIEIRINRARN